MGVASSVAWLKEMLMLLPIAELEQLLAAARQANQPVHIDWENHRLMITET